MSPKKTLPFSLSKTEQVISEFGSPVYIYDEAGIRATARQLYNSFTWAKGYKNYFAVKATPTPGILKILLEEGMGFDCSSRTELELLKRMGVTGNKLFFTSNNTTKEDFELAIELGAIINIDDLTQIPVFLSALNDRAYDRVAIRLNPGHQQSGNAIIGEPVEAKYGVRIDQLEQAYELLKTAQIKHLGLHTMVASNERNADYFSVTAKILNKSIRELGQKDIKIDFLNLGGGFGIPYKPEDSPLDIAKVSELIKEDLKDFEGEIYTENGRYITGPHGYLITKVRYVIDKYKSYIGVDASMHNLMRPGMYGAYHHITVLGKGDDRYEVFDVVGSLCENNDKFAIDRNLPEVKQGDIMVIHDAGAHGHSMGFNYNGLLKCPEILLSTNGSQKCVRRAEELSDLFASIIW